MNMLQDYEGLQVKKLKEGAIPVSYMGDIDDDCWGKKEETGYSCIPEKDVIQVLKEVLSEGLKEFSGEKTLVAFVDVERGDWKYGQYEDHEESVMEVRYYFEVLSLHEDKAYLIPLEIEVVRSLYLDEDEKKRFRRWLIYGGEPVGFWKSYDVFEIKGVKYEVYEVVGGPEAATSWEEFPAFSDIKEW